jgi:hypothetical protein
MSWGLKKEEESQVYKQFSIQNEYFNSIFLNSNLMQKFYEEKNIKIIKKRYLTLQLCGSIAL